VAHVSLRTEQRDAVAVITLDRPEAMNAFDAELVEKLTTVFADASRDASVRAILLQAEGRAFSAGADLAWMRAMADAPEAVNLDDARRLARLMQTVDVSPKPTIARVQGAAFGGALGLIACCDVAIASGDAVFCVSEVRLGLVPSVIGPYLVRAVGVRAARRLTVTAERFGAAEALRLGLVHAVVETGALDSAVERSLASALEGGPEAIAAAKSLFADLSRPVDDATMEETSKRIAAIRAGAEAREGVAAFLDKRKPGWRT
jgi:methylglutaconyl-CoA hydratase